jgi:hypothetical protein
MDIAGIKASTDAVIAQLPQFEGFINSQLEKALLIRYAAKTRAGQAFTVSPLP